MSIKITKEEFIKRFKKIHPESQIELLEYTAISKPCAIKCLDCGEIHKYANGNKALTYSWCCDKIDKLSSIRSRLDKDYQYIKQVDRNYIILKHISCGNEFKRAINSAYKEPNSCPHCKNWKQKLMIPIEEVQSQLDEQFDKQIKILEYNGQLEKNTYKCLKCGLIFKRNSISQKASKGCPKCDSQKSNGERKMAKLLRQHNLEYKEQITFDDLPLLRFDFGVYKENKLLYLIEIQGEQHYQDREIFRDSLEIIQERDERKRQYCKEHNITLYEIPWIKGHFHDLDKLPF